MKTDGKKRTWKQWKALEEKKALLEPEDREEIRYGVCMCGNGSFKHYMQNRELVRVCKECGHEKVV